MIVLTVAPQIQPRTKHTTIKYHHFQSIAANGIVKIQHVDTREQVADIFTKPLDSGLFLHLRYIINSWQITGISCVRESEITYLIGYLGRCFFPNG